jgi:hypothetical protein
VPSLRHPLHQPLAHRPHRSLLVPQPSFPYLQNVVLFDVGYDYTSTHSLDVCIHHDQVVQRVWH